MNRSKEEKLADIMLGEAVLKILHEGGAISCASLTEKLAEMAAHEGEATRRQACLRAADDVSRSRDGTAPATAYGGNTVAQFLATRGPDDDGKKH